MSLSIAVEAALSLFPPAPMYWSGARVWSPFTRLELVVFLLFSLVGEPECRVACCGAPP